MSISTGCGMSTGLLFSEYTAPKAIIPSIKTEAIIFLYFLFFILFYFTIHAYA